VKRVLKLSIRRPEWALEKGIEKGKEDHGLLDP